MKGSNPFPIKYIKGIKHKAFLERVRGKGVAKAKSNTGCYNAYIMILYAASRYVMRGYVHML